VENVQSIKFKQETLGGILGGVGYKWISGRLHKSIFYFCAKVWWNLVSSTDLLWSARCITRDGVWMTAKQRILVVTEHTTRVATEQTSPLMTNGNGNMRK